MLASGESTGVELTESNGNTRRKTGSECSPVQLKDCELHQKASRFFLSPDSRY